MAHKKKSAPFDRSQMDKGSIGWMVKFVRKHYWRMCSYMDFDDILQEGYAAYYEVLERYPTAVDRPHIMRLFQLVFNSKIQILAKLKTRQVDECVGDLLCESESDFESSKLRHYADPSQPWQVVLPDHSMAPLCHLLKHAPPHIANVLQLFTTEEGRQKLRTPPRRRADGSRETLNERLRRLTHCPDPTLDLVREVQTYFG